MNLIKHDLIKNIFSTTIKSISTSPTNFGFRIGVNEWKRTLPHKDEGVQGFDLVGVEDYEKRFLKHVDFPSLGVEDKEFDGMLFSEIPILEMTVHKNNTRLACFDNLYSKMIDYTSGVG